MKTPASKSPHYGANSTNGKKTTTVPTLQIEVDLADAASTSMDLRTSDTWEMEQSKAEWVEAEKRQQLDEEKARLLLMGVENPAEANDDSIEMGIGELRRMLDGAASAVADMFGSAVAPGMQQEEKKEEMEKGVEPTAKDVGRIVSNPVDLDEVPSDLSSIANDNDGNSDGKAAAAATAVIVEERLLASAKAEAARAALWKQAANKNDTTNSCGGGRAVVVDNDDDGDHDDDADIVRLNRINKAMFQRIDAKQQRQEQMDMVVARETTGVSAATGLTTSGDVDGDASASADRRVVREQSLTGSYTDVSENFMMESFLFLNRDDRNKDGDDDDGGEEKKEGNQSAGTPATKTAANMDDKNNDDIIAAQDVDFFTEDDEYGNCKITCDEHMINRIDDIVCSSAVCSALPEKFLGGEDDDDDDDLEEGAQGDL